MSGWMPDLQVPKLTEIAPHWLTERKIRGVVLDLDNTLVPWHSEDIPADVFDWVGSLHANSIRACIASNTLNFARLSRIAAQLEIDHVPANARKPSATGVLRAVHQMGTSPESSAMVGDQLLTDMIAGRRAGLAATVLVHPLSPREFLGTKLINRPIERLLMSSWRSQ